MNNKQEDEYIEDDYQSSGSRVPKWALIAGVVLVFLCLAVLLTLFLARTKILNAVVGVLTTDTPIPTETVPATETFTPSATDTLAPAEGPTEAPTATAIPMPPAAISAIAQGGPVLEEDFADNSMNWIGINDKSEVTIQEQKLQLHSTDTGKPAVGLCQGDTCGPYKDYYYFQSDIVEDHPSTLALGLVFGMNEAKTAFYSFAIKPSSAEFALYKVTNGQWNILIDWTSASAIKFYPFVNIAGVSYSEGTIQLFANGQQLGAYTDKQTPFNSGRIGFSVETDGVRLLASNVKVFNLAPVAPQIPAGQGVTYQTPTPQIKISPTPTKWGACPPGIPEGMFVFVVFRANNKPADITIDGVRKKITTGANQFYLSLGDTHIIELGNKTLQLTYKTCMIRQVNYNK